MSLTIDRVERLEKRVEIMEALAGELTKVMDAHRIAIQVLNTDAEGIAKSMVELQDDVAALKRN